MQTVSFFDAQRRRVIVLERPACSLAFRVPAADEVAPPLFIRQDGPRRVVVVDPEDPDGDPMSIDWGLNEALAAATTREQRLALLWNRWMSQRSPRNEAEALYEETKASTIEAVADLLGELADQARTGTVGEVDL